MELAYPHLEILLILLFHSYSKFVHLRQLHYNQHHHWHFDGHMFAIYGPPSNCATAICWKICLRPSISLVNSSPNSATMAPETSFTMTLMVIAAIYHAKLMEL